MKNGSRMTSRRAVLAAFLIFSVFSFSGCSGDRLQMEKKILACDAAFQGVLKKRDLHNAELSALKAAYTKVRDSIDSQIAVLRDKKARARREYDASAEKIKLQFQPEIRNVERDIAEVQRRYELKSSEMRNVERDMNEINYLMRKKDKLILTEEETKTWTSRLSELTEKKAALSAELAKIKEQLVIEKMKLKVMSLK